MITVNNSPSLSKFSTHYIQWGIILASLVLIGGLFFKTLSPLLEDRAMILEGTLFTHELQSSILDTVFLGQIQGVHNDDHLNNQAIALKKILQQMKMAASVQSKPELHAELSNLLSLAHQQSDAVDTFKGIHSVLQNSRAHFPAAFDACAHSFDHQGQLTPEVSDFLQKTFITGLLPDREIYASPSPVKLQQYAQFSESCTTFFNHAKLLAEYTPKELQIHNRIFDLGLHEGLHKFYRHFEQMTSSVIAHNKTLYLIISLFSILLLLYIGFTLITSHRASADLERTLNHLSKQQTLFTALIKANSAIANSNDRVSLYQQICDIATSDGLFDSAWIGELQPNLDVLPIATSGAGAELISTLPFSANPDKLEGQGLIRACIECKKAVITNRHTERLHDTIWADLGVKWNVQGSASLPIVVEGQAVGCFVAYTQKTDFFDAENSLLLQQFADDLGNALVRLKSQRELAVSAIAFESHEAILIVDASKKIVRCNKAFTLLTGYSEAEALGNNPRLLKSGVHDRDFYKNLWQSVHQTGIWKGEIWNRKKDGTLYANWQSISSVHNSAGEITHYVSHALDLTRDKASEQQISYLHKHDNLTKLPNRSLLIDRLELLLERNNPHFNFLLLININRFKMLNESMGYAGGDELLKQFAARLNAFKFNEAYSHTVARIGNDEFVVLSATEHDSPEKALKFTDAVIRKLQSKLREPFSIYQKPVMMDTSMGVTLFTVEDREAESLMQEANTALTRAKQRSKQMPQSTVQFFSNEMQRRSQDRLDLEMQLRNALKQSEFILYYQPQIELKTGKIIGAESLIRWQKADGTLIPPSHFIPTLEESALILPVGLWILEEAITQAKFLTSIYPDITISVNLSAFQFHDDDLLNKVTSILEQTQYPPELLELEVTESLLMTDIQDTITKLNAFADLGIKIAVDDFGTGYSSLAYLKRFPVSKVKIDKTFIDDLSMPNSSDAAIVAATIQMANALNIRTIAEGVETKEQLKLLTEMGCDEIQGYYFSKPLPFHELVQFMSNFHDNNP